MIYDCFLFYDEFTLLDIRLAELGKTVDKFVLVESPFTFSGQPKGLFFSDAMPRYAKWKDRIVPLVSHPAIPDENRWNNERNQRNALGDYLKDVCKSDDLVILTDADEIASKEAVERAASLSVPGRLYMGMYYYFFNCKRSGYWPWPAFCRYGDFLRIFKGIAQSLRLSQESTPERIKDAGWHFSYIMSPERISRKIGAFSHSEYDNPQCRDIHRIENCRRDHTDLFERSSQVYQTVGLDELPESVSSHPEKYSEFLTT